jgi:hypothetical protein
MSQSLSSTEAHDQTTNPSTFSTLGPTEALESKKYTTEALESKKYTTLTISQLRWIVV